MPAKIFNHKGHKAHKACPAAGQGKKLCALCVLCGAVLVAAKVALRKAKTILAKTINSFFNNFAQNSFAFFETPE